jgi:hypothetical protein
MPSSHSPRHRTGDRRAASSADVCDPEADSADGLHHRPIRSGEREIHLGRLHVIAQRSIKHALRPVAVAAAFGVGTVVGEEAPLTESKGAQISAPEHWRK